MENNSEFVSTRKRLHQKRRENKKRGRFTLLRLPYTHTHSSQGVFFAPWPPSSRSITCSLFLSPAAHKKEIRSALIFSSLSLSLLLLPLSVFFVYVWKERERETWFDLVSSIETVRYWNIPMKRHPNPPPSTPPQTSLGSVKTANELFYVLHSAGSEEGPKPSFAMANLIFFLIQFTLLLLLLFFGNGLVTQTLRFWLLSSMRWNGSYREL